MGFFSDMIAVFHLLLYVANTQEGRTTSDSSKCCCCCSNELMFAVGLFSAFCLSWVGAICDDDDGAMCQGNNSIHSMFAVLFFALTDFIALAMVADPKTEKAREPRERRIAAVIAMLLAVSTVTHATGRSLVSVYPGWQLWDNITIIAEVIEVTIFLYWMNNVAHSHFGNLSWGAVSFGDNAEDSETPVVVLSARGLAKLTSAISVAVLVTTLAIALSMGTIDPLTTGGLPIIGDMWTHKPSNWISRWGLVQFSSGALWVSLFSQLAAISSSQVLHSAGPFSSSSSLLGLVDYLVLFLQSVAALAAACTAVCASTENATYHQIAAATFFIAGNLGAVAICVVDGVRHMSSTTSDCGHRGGSNGWKMRALLAATGTILMAVHCGLCYFSPNPCGSAMSALEWADVLILIAFYTYNCLGRDGTATMGLAVITGTPSEQKGPCKA